jgi:hypothetical protein
MLGMGEGVLKRVCLMESLRAQMAETNKYLFNFFVFLKKVLMEVKKLRKSIVVPVCCLTRQDNHFDRLEEPLHVCSSPRAWNKTT